MTLEPGLYEAKWFSATTGEIVPAALRAGAGLDPSQASGMDGLGLTAKECREISHKGGLIGNAIGERSGLVFYGENLFDDAPANSIHLLVKVHGAVVITNGKFDLVSDLDPYAWVQNLDGRVFGVQGLEAQSVNALNRG